MVSILKSQTDGEVVYLYDPESTAATRASRSKSVHLKNPSDSALETGPVTVFGEGHFIGEGMAEPIPARGSAFVPFALDRQIVVDQSERRDATRSRASSRSSAASSRPRCSTGGRRPSPMNNRLDERATVYVRHTVPDGLQAHEGSGRGWRARRSARRT